MRETSTNRNLLIPMKPSICPIQIPTSSHRGKAKGRVFGQEPEIPEEIHGLLYEPPHESVPYSSKRGTYEG